jgi:predicted MFS family arabinose efflux permease
MVFLGLLPFVVLAAIPPLVALRRIGPPDEPTIAASRLVPALRVAAGAGLALAALADRSLLALPLAAAAVVVGARPLIRLLPPGTLRAGPGLPATVLARGLLTFAFFGAETFVPLAVVAVRHRSTALAGLALTAAAISWTVAAWVQERLVARTSPRKLVGGGMAIIVIAIAGAAAVLADRTPIGVAAIAWAVGGFGIGLAYSTLSLVVLREAAPGQEGTVTSALQLSENLGVAFGAGLGGAAVAVGAARGVPATGIAVAYAVTALAAVAGVAVARRLPASPLEPRE